MKYKVILWDADGVLIKATRRFSNRLTEEHGIPIEKITPFFIGPFGDCTLGKADLKEELAKVIDNWGWKGTVDELLTYWFTAGTEIDQEAVAYIQELRTQGVRCYMTTDNEKYRSEHLREVLGGGKVLEEVFYAARIGAVKKESAFWEYVLQYVAAKPEEILLVDDGQENVDTAKSLGINACFYTSLDDLKKIIAA